MPEPPRAERFPVRFLLASAIWSTPPDRLAPAAYVESTLAQRALERGDLAAAQRCALRLPASPNRDELLASIAEARGQGRLALEYSLAAFDSDAG